MRPLVIAVAIVLAAPIAFADDEELPDISLDELLSGGTVASGRSTDFSGALQAKAYGDLHQENDSEDLWGFRALVSAEATANINRLSFLFSGFAEYDIDANYDESSADYYAELYELYAKYSVSKFDVRIGQQEFNWGKTDIINPIDQLNPTDYTRMFHADMGFTEIPVLSARLDFYASDYHRFQFVYVPFFEPAKIDFVGSDWALMKHGIPFGDVIRYLEDRYEELEMYEGFLDWLIPDWRGLVKDEINDALSDLNDYVEEPSDDFEHYDLGFLYSGRLGSLDYDLCYIHAIDDFPTIHASPELIKVFDAISPLDVSELLSIDPEKLKTPIIGRYHRTNSAGLAFETGAGGVGVRGEALYTWDRYVYLDDFRLRRMGMTSGVLGVDYLFPHDYYANVQLLEVVTEGDPDKLLWEKYFTFVMLVLRKPFARERWEVEAGTMADLTFMGTEELAEGDLSDLDFHTTVFVSHTPADNWRVYGGVSYFSGDSYSPLGYFSENSQAFAGLKYSF